MDYAVHLPLIALDGRPWSLRRLLEYAELAEDLGFGALSANDHLLFPRPWLDGPTALAAVLAVAERIALATTVALPTVRGPRWLWPRAWPPSTSSRAAVSSLGWAPAPPPGTTLQSESPLRSAGSAWMRPCIPCALCGTGMGRRFGASSTRRRV